MPFLILKNIPWMTFNVLLALIPVLFGWLIIKTKTKSLKILFFIAWLLFIPNTVYIFTDIIHFFKDIRHASITGIAFIIVQYTLLLTAGFLTFIFSLYPIEKILNKKSKKHSHNAAHFIILINFLIGFGIVLGRIFRLNSWDILLASEKLISASAQIISSPKLLIVTILFGLFTNALYFFFKKDTVETIIKKM